MRNFYWAATALSVASVLASATADADSFSFREPGYRGDLVLPGVTSDAYSTSPNDLTLHLAAGSSSTALQALELDALLDALLGNGVRFDGTLVATTPSDILTARFRGLYVSSIQNSPRGDTIRFGFSGVTVSDPPISAPEIDPTLAAGGLMLLAGGLAVARGRRRHGHGMVRVGLPARK